MLASQLDNYRNRRPILNTTQFNAWAIARRIMQFNWWNLRYWFMPPIVMSVVVMPISIDMEDGLEESPFTPDMFRDGGWLHEEPLNHFIRIQPFGKRYSFLVNAGYFANNFLESNKYGYEVLKEIITLAKKNKIAPDPLTTKPDPIGEIQEEGPSV